MHMTDGAGLEMGASKHLASGLPMYSKWLESLNHWMGAWYQLDGRCYIGGVAAHGCVTLCGWPWVGGGTNGKEGKGKISPLITER